MSSGAGRDPASVAVTGVVLAGGRSRRFGPDKLAAMLDGRPLLEHAILRLAPLVDELIVAIASDDDPPGAPSLAIPFSVVRDPVPAAGPLVGLLAGLRAATGPIAVVTGGDMPWLAPPVVVRLVEAVAGAAAASAASLGDHGVARPLPSALRIDRALPVAERLTASGERSLRSFLDALEAAIIPEALWRSLDPDGWSLLDVDTPADLASLKERRSRRPV